MRAVAAAAGAIIALAAPARAQESDVREFRVGMALAALPAAGYKDFACLGETPPKPIAGWDAYKACPADGSGGREVGFRYDDPGRDETRVAGQEVLMSLVLGGDGTLEAIRIRTDPHARLFRRKRGYLFGEQVMARYGEADWSCADAAPLQGEEPVGGVFMRRHCEKVLGDRHLTIDRALYRRQSDGPADFVSQTSFTVSLVRGE